MVEVRQAAIEDLESVVPLFEAYRQFYRRTRDPERARLFLRERLELKQSIIFLAFEGTRAVGFAQLYPVFSSALLARTFILNDLFVTPEERGRGAATALIAAAGKYGRAAGAVQLVLSTELTNQVAQSLYEKLGWKRDTVFCVYRLSL